GPSVKVAYDGLGGLGAGQNNLLKMTLFWGGILRGVITKVFGYLGFTNRIVLPEVRNHRHYDCRRPRLRNWSCRRWGRGRPYSDRAWLPPHVADQLVGVHIPHETVVPLAERASARKV